MNQPFKDHFKNQMKPQNAEFENRIFQGPSEQYLFEKIFPWILPRIIGAIRFHFFPSQIRATVKLNGNRFRVDMPLLY